MDTPDVAITKLYCLDGAKFGARLEIMLTNLKRVLLESFRDAPDFCYADADDKLSALVQPMIHGQRAACRTAAITDEQRQDFENRLDNCLADAVLAVRDTWQTFGQTMSTDFTLAATKKLRIPVA